MHPLTLWSVRIACVLYVLAIGAWLIHKRESARIAWTLGLLAYLVHVAAAFSYHHSWSHDAAYEETARQTAELFRIRWGGGLYFNYLFTVVWSVDAAWTWLDPAGYLTRRRWIATSIHGFLAFMFFNATVVFANGWVRWSALASALVLTLLWMKQRLA